MSTRHAFVLAFDLVHRDWLHSVIVPVLLRVPWIFAQAYLPAADETDRPELVYLLSMAAFFGDILVLLIVSAMLRQRARSVYERPHGTAPAPITSCYAWGLARVPWLIVTELIRGIIIVISGFFFFFPAIFFGFRLGVATEAVVLDQPDMPAAIRRSFDVMKGRFGEWFPMVLLSLVLIFAVAFSAGFLVAVASVFNARFGFSAGVAIGQLAVAAAFPVVQYAWTFFYLQICDVTRPHIPIAASGWSNPEEAQRMTPPSPPESFSSRPPAMPGTLPAADPHGGSPLVSKQPLQPGEQPPPRPPEVPPRPGEVPGPRPEELPPGPPEEAPPGAPPEQLPEPPAAPPRGTPPESGGF